MDDPVFVEAENATMFTKGQDRYVHLRGLSHEEEESLNRQDACFNVSLVPNIDQCLKPNVELILPSYHRSVYRFLAERDSKMKKSMIETHPWTM